MLALLSIIPTSFRWAIGGAIAMLGVALLTWATHQPTKVQLATKAATAQCNVDKVTAQNAALEKKTQVLEDALRDRDVRDNQRSLEHQQLSAALRLKEEENERLRNAAPDKNTIVFDNSDADWLRGKSSPRPKAPANAGRSGPEHGAVPGTSGKH